MERIYLDNASTTFPKPETVAQSVYEYMTTAGSIINRGCYQSAYSVEESVFDTRQRLAELFNGGDCRNVLFTKNVTESLNVILKGFLKPGDHVLVSAMEHNAMMRPLNQLAEQGITFDRIPCTETGELRLDAMEDLLRPNTRLIAMLHASNVCGTVMPIRQVGEFARAHGLKFLVDCAQTAGVLSIDMEEMGIDALAFTGHKGLLAPQGIGGFLLKEEMVARIEPLLSGGTGSVSHTEEIPAFMPDRFEPGTMNLPGILGLQAGLAWLEETGIDRVREHELALTEEFLRGLMPLEEQGLLRIVGRRDCRGRTGVVSIQTVTRELSQTAFELDGTYGIQTRVGLHCAPSAHKTLGTFPTGTIRFSFGWWNTPEQVEAAGISEISGMNLLDMDTLFRGEKVQTQTEGIFENIPGLFACLNGLAYQGYEIHMGRSMERRSAVTCKGNVYGSYIHGIFDAPGVAEAILGALCRKKGLDPARLGSFDPKAYKEAQYDKLADAVRSGLDMELVYRVLNREV